MTEIVPRYSFLCRSIKEYVSKFKDNDKGFKLLGDILFAMNKRQEALESYEKSLELNAAQEDVLSNGEYHFGIKYQNMLY